MTEPEIEEAAQALTALASRPAVSGERKTYELRPCVRSQALRASKRINPVVLFYDHDDDPVPGYFRFSLEFENMVGRALVRGIHPDRPAVISVTHVAGRYYVWACYRAEANGHVLLWHTTEKPTWIKTKKRRSTNDNG
ncbi:hypothetical protein JT27_18530 [Alcaligenes faecalis]|uniref:hypothetical protein n=1 Tax=Alcaligenes faecalis TaxID=511 RepID=UPI00052BC96D|nr:hypothetical protein [Alcaligenes faecalis]KGP00322.1 hypothetical protein JT27_18530 [Alcaligenes faecalis]